MVSASRTRFRALPDFRQQPVAGAVSLRATDLPETVRIEITRRQSARLASCRGERRFAAVAQQAAIGRPGQLIALHHVLESGDPLSPPGGGGDLRGRDAPLVGPRPAFRPHDVRDAPVLARIAIFEPRAGWLRQCVVRRYSGFADGDVGCALKFRTLQSISRGAGRMINTHHPRGFFEAISAFLLRATLKLLLKPVFSPRWSIGFQRRWLAGLARTTWLPGGVSIEQAEVGGVPGEWLRRRDVPPAKTGVILYMHGGAYCLGSAAGHRALTSRLALATGLPVFSLDYRLAPEHPFPAAIDDAVAAFRALSDKGPVIVAGDSAGGGLALATALALRDDGSPLPAALVLLSPWVDLGRDSAPLVPPPGEAMLSTEWAAACAALYVGNAPPDSPLASPLRADLRGLPPTLIQVGTDELLLDQSVALHDAMLAAGVDVRCDITARRWHVFQMHGGAMRSADDAIARISRFLLQPLAAATPPGASRHEVVILGAGMSGLCMAIQLKRAGIEDFVIIEKQDGLGGTWWDNTYPGAHVDVPSPVYSFSFAPNPDWSRRFASAPEIQRYMQQVAERHGLLGHMRLGTRLAEATFDESSGRWKFATEGGDTLSARFFVCSTGPLSQLRWPDVPGLEDFRGKKIHSARWDHDYALTGRQVAVIGTGSTASQLVPPVAGQAQQLYVFQRTANWVMPRLDRPYNTLDRLLAHFPPYAALVRKCWTQVLELGRRGFDEGTLARRSMLWTAAAHLKKQVPDEALRRKLTPPYPLGCKRIIYSNDFYAALVRPNVELVTDAIERITANGVITTDGRERGIDTLVCATGFDTVHLLSSVRVTGLGGRTLSDAWADGPEAYHGITVSGFPNMFLMLGPNTATGHTSTLLYIEPEVQHAITCMQAVRTGGHRWIDVRADVLGAHNRALQARLGSSVWSQCRSWYRMESGRVIAIFPGFTNEYVRSVKQVDLSHYTLA
jgi:cation diffusion facilitator CzcD-associated flavoprotein CzcO/acetyl esterase/lipase